MAAMGHSRHFDSPPLTSSLPRSAAIAGGMRQFRKVLISRYLLPGERPFSNGKFRSTAFSLLWPRRRQLEFSKAIFCYFRL
jgi:hypothetical protein